MFIQVQLKKMINIKIVFREERRQVRMTGRVERVHSRRTRSKSLEPADKRLSIAARLQQHAGYEAIKPSSDVYV